MSLISTQEKRYNQQTRNDSEDEFGDDLNTSDLIQVATSVEQKYAAKISFIPEEDPTPPPALPEDTESFHPLDVENLRTWIYPINYPIRGYQLNIIQKALFNNTLVALPTGLGKTFIAAVVMFNYWRWYPNSKIIFMAPTRPLVTQQTEACFTICGLPLQDTVEISGQYAPVKRRDLWKRKRVFFSTPETVCNDIKNQACPTDKIVCVVVDEAHRATGKYAYTQVISELSKTNNHYRVLALTATPGSSLKAVQSVINNLNITNIQIRTEDSIDVREYSYSKSIESFIVPVTYTQGATGILPRIINEYTSQVYEPILQQLSKSPNTGIQPEAALNTNYGIQKKKKTFQVTGIGINKYLKSQIITNFLVAEQMSRAYDLLCQYGIVSFVEHMEGLQRDKKAQFKFSNHPSILRMLLVLKKEMVKPDFSTHPKMDVLVRILVSHFSSLKPDESSKAMIFSSYRCSVSEICKALNTHNPLIRASSFVGQAVGNSTLKGLKQSEQQEIIRKFKSNELNVIVSTSIGEEGLDIGEVDLIVCYDSQSSPIRMLQRMGRTGRKRQGKCILLLTETEQKKFNQAKDTYARVQNLISRGERLIYYQPSTSILPSHYKPTLRRKYIHVGEYCDFSTAKPRMLLGTELDGFIDEDAEKAFVQSFCNRYEQYTDITQVLKNYWPNESLLKRLNSQVPLQSKVTKSHLVGHSKRTFDFVNLVQKMEERILHPDENLKTITSQTLLTIPAKSKASPFSTLNIPKKRYRYDDNVTDLAKFYKSDVFMPSQENDFETISFLQDIKDYNSAERFMIDPEMSEMVDDTMDFEPSIDCSVVDSKYKDERATKGKGLIKVKNMNRSSAESKEKGGNAEPYLEKSIDKGKIKENEEFDEFDSFDIDARAWEQMWTDTMGNNDVKPDTKMTLKDDIRDNKSILDDDITSKRNISLDKGIALENENLLKSHVTMNKETSQQSNSTLSLKHDKEKIDAKVQGNKSVTVLDTDAIYSSQNDEDDFGFDDFPLDELLLEEAKDSAFKFSAKALELLDKRQNAIKRATGKFVPMSVISKYN